MFEFEDLDGMTRPSMLRKQGETIVYWRTMHRLKGAFLAWGRETSALLYQSKQEGQDNKLITSMGDAAVRGEITVLKLTNLLKRLDDYLKDMDTRLSDGSKWFNAQEISDMFNEIKGD